MYNSLGKIDICNLKKYLSYGGNPSDWTRNGLESKQVGYFSLLKDVRFCKESLKLNTGPINKRKCCNSGMTFLK